MALTPPVHPAWLLFENPSEAGGTQASALPPSTQQTVHGAGHRNNAALLSPVSTSFGNRGLVSRGSAAGSRAASLASKYSVSSMYHSAVGSQRGGAMKKLRSQYPADATENHVEFILVASFDIDRGSVMEHQYPGSISDDEHMLAELMLPEGTHNRSQDWTVFFLHKDGEAEEAEAEHDRKAKRRRARRSTEKTGDARNSHDAEKSRSEDGFSSSGDSDEDLDYNTGPMEGPALIYVLNLVNTKHDPSFKRGAVVKAMAVCTRHPFLHIYKPLLLLALEEYFKNPVPETLAVLYDAVNSMDLSLMPRLTILERIILQQSNAKDLFIEKFQAMIELHKAEESSHTTTDSPGKMGQQAAARYVLPKDTHEFESRIMYNGMAIPVKIPTAKHMECVGDFSIIKLIQTFSGPHAQSPQPFALHPHLTTNGAYTHPIIVLVNALLTQKRVMFLGHNRPSGEVVEAVLAACALASGGILRGFTRHAFPYTDLTKIDDLLKVPGFVAGVTNPAFANKPEWWDLLCDLPTGRMKISSKIEQPPVTDAIASFQQQNPAFASALANSQSNSAQDPTGDVAFMEKVQSNIINRLGEGVIRSMWQEWIIKLTRMAAAFEETVYGASALYIGGEEADAGAFGVRGHGYVWPDENAKQRELAANVSRIEGWRNTRSYYSLVQDLAHLYEARPISSVDLHHQHDRLRTLKLQREESAAVYLALEKAIHRENEINQLLTVTPESHGGLFYVSLGLLHPRREVRYKTVELLDRIQKHEAGLHFWERLGRFAKLAFFRIKREKEASRGKVDDDDRELTRMMSQTSLDINT